MLYNAALVCNIFQTTTLLNDTLCLVLTITIENDFLKQIVLIKFVRPVINSFENVKAEAATGSSVH